MAIGPRSGVPQTVTPDDVQVGIGKERVGEARLATQVGGDLRWVHADGDRTNTARLEFLKVLLNAS